MLAVPIPCSMMSVHCHKVTLPLSDFSYMLLTKFVFHHPCGIDTTDFFLNQQPLLHTLWNFSSD
jgi:hypothetical protein